MAARVSPKVRLLQADFLIFDRCILLGNLGVKGRHFSLTHFYPWMREEFELTHKEKFTMLSGIAHDPIQRDSEFLSMSFHYGARDATLTRF